MIWSKEFVWLHLPKCGGTAIASMFGRYFADLRALHQDSWDIRVDPTVAWHDSLAQREKREPGFRAENRMVIVPIRRLPSWLISMYNYERSRSPHLDHDPERLLQGRFMTHVGNVEKADGVIRQYIPETLVESGRLQFVRLEYLEMDFRAVFGQSIDVSRVPSHEFDRKVNVSTNHVPDSIRHRLLHDNEELYRLCPAWEAIERLAYGRSGLSGRS